MDASISVVVVGQDSLVVDVEGFFFVARHEVDVELGYADLAEAVELLAMLLTTSSVTNSALSLPTSQWWR